MATGLHTFVDMYVRVLDAGAHILDKGAQHASAAGEDPDAILDWRLIDDMHPLRFQLCVVCDFVREWTARAADVPLGEETSQELDVAGFAAAIADARAFLEGLDPSRFAGRDDLPLTVSIAGGSMEPTLSVEKWLTGFATTNVYFHLSIAYAILRARGVPLGKVDLFPTGL